MILYRELYYRHVYSRLNPDIDDRFHSYENSCELFNYLLSMCYDSIDEMDDVVDDSIRFGWTCDTPTPGPMVVGHTRRVHLPVSVFLRMAVESQEQNRGGTFFADRGQSGSL